MSLIEAGVSQAGAGKPLAPPAMLKRGRGLGPKELEAALTDNRYSHYASPDELNRYMDDLRAERDDVTSGDHVDDMPQ